MTAIASTPIPAGSTWAVDAVHSTVGFAVKHMVVSTFRGRSTATTRRSPPPKTARCA